MIETPRANRLHIGLFGRRNAGKSSLINLLTGQHTAIVSDTPGTTADPVLKSMELLPLGPIVFIDTAGLDDEGALGEQRIARSREMMQRCDLALLVVPAEEGIDLQPEKTWIHELQAGKIALLGVLNQVDRVEEVKSLQHNFETQLGIPLTPVSALTGLNRSLLLQAIVKEAPLDFERPCIVGDLISRGDAVILVAPQDLQAPKGRLILPQVQTIRDILDYGGLALTAKDSELPFLLKALSAPPSLVITDSQVFPKVRDMLDPATRLTSFSVLMARYKGDLATFVRGARKINTLKESDKVLIAEACTHHALEDDIGRTKIPRWLKQKVGEGLQVDIAAGIDFPPNLKEYALIVHCGGCMFTRKQLMARLIQADAADVPITNYGTLIAALNNMLERVVSIFPEIEPTKS